MFNRKLNGLIKWTLMSNKVKEEYVSNKYKNVKLAVYGACGDIEGVTTVKYIGYSPDTKKFEFQTSNNFYTSVYVEESSAFEDWYKENKKHINLFSW